MRQAPNAAQLHTGFNRSASHMIFWEEVPRRKTPVRLTVPSILGPPIERDARLDLWLANCSLVH